MKRVLSFILATCLVLTALSGCSQAALIVSGDYIGYWCDEENASYLFYGPDGINEMKIISIESNEVIFELTRTVAPPGHIIANSAGPIAATIENHLAQFEYEDGRGGLIVGSIEFADNKIMVKADTIGSIPDVIDDIPRVSLQMDCVMLRDLFYDEREVFGGVKGNYNQASDPSDELLEIDIGEMSGDSISMTIRNAYDVSIYTKEMLGKIISSSEVTVDIPDSNVVIHIRWNEPGEIVITRMKGDLPAELFSLDTPQTYWNSEYLQTN
jgi:hypothetical protein